MIPYFTLAIRIEMEQSARIERLKKREKQRYGLRIEQNGDMYQKHIEFIEWAKSYDNGGLDIRSKAMHDELEKSFPCKILYLDGEDDLNVKFEKVLKVLENPQVIKTPVVRNGKQSTLGYQPDVWKKWE